MTVWLHGSCSKVHFPTFEKDLVGSLMLALGQPSLFHRRNFDRPNLTHVKPIPNPLGLVNSSAQDTTNETTGTLLWLVTVCETEN